MSGIVGVEAYGTMPGYAGGALGDQTEARRMVQNRAMSLLKQDHSHARKIREYEDQAKADQMRIAQLEGMLRLARKVLVDGDEAERKDVAGQINKLKIGGMAA